jgi:hypothetical protein
VIRECGVVKEMDGTVREEVVNPGWADYVGNDGPGYCRCGVILVPFPGVCFVIEVEFVKEEGCLGVFFVVPSLVVKIAPYNDWAVGEKVSDEF